MQFTIDGNPYELTRESVEAALGAVEPAAVTKYSVEALGRRWPVKQVLAVATGLTTKPFDSGKAQRVLAQLGFAVEGELAARTPLDSSQRTFDGVNWSLASSEDGYLEARSGRLHVPTCRHGVTQPRRSWTEAEILDAWFAAPDTDPRELTSPGWCSDCLLVRGLEEEVTRSEESSPTGSAERRAIAAAAGVILTPGLSGAASALDATVRTWTAPTARALRGALDSLPDASGGFRGRLLQQLADAPRDVVLLAAELCFVQRLPLTNVGAGTKRELLREILALLPDAPALPEAVAAAFDVRGTFSGGAGFTPQIARHLQWLCSFIEHWDGLDAETRDAALGDPWLFREQTVAVDPASPAIQSSLLALTWPSVFERIVSTADKTKIRDTFAPVLPSGPTGDLDRDLLHLRDRLDPQGHLDIDWYLPPWSTEWRSADRDNAPAAWCVPSRAVLGDTIGFPGAITADFGASRAAIRATALARWDGAEPISALLQRVDSTAAVLSGMRPGEQILVRDDRGIRVGKLRSGRWMPGDRAQRSVRWEEDRVPEDALPQAVLDALSHDDAFIRVEPLSMPTPTPTDLRLPRPTAEFAAGLHYDRAWLGDVTAVLEERRQIILFGPPGTGKTFVARALARFAAPASAVRIVQFHPSYSYEDFFEGFRPATDGSGSAVFRLAKGPLRLLADSAVRNPAVPHVLIIDEINRGNMAKIFGELYFLLEYRDEQVSLQYSPEEPFALPKNLFVIGTMNTADRSISLVDAAIRRRFAFFELHPAQRPVHGLIHRVEGRTTRRGALLDTLNERIGETDRDFQIGPSYLLRVSARTEDGLVRIWEHDILPLLDEHYYGRLSREEIRARFGLDALDLTTPLVVDEIDEA
ncbi:AAA family ATPase [Rathayibacter caricis]|uniref:AAA family ATPase n=1 Tax=Rathayibacter caricis TaxID=110936 RepID=UPI001FB31B76|nr:AAA family ATPase [Rathayibacter caricis]MCJ1696729.1 AAA family ATPase [Rathayibacter caricis]